MPAQQSTERPLIIAMHMRSGMTALNVVTAALEADPRTANLDVVFVRDVAGLADVLHAEESREPKRAVLVLWSFYSPDFLATRDDVRSIRERERASVLHIAGGVHATAEPLATLEAGFDLVALGEGETTIIDVVLSVMRGQDPRTQSLAGTAYLDPLAKEPRLVSHGPGERRELDAFPPFNARFRKWNAIEITRGCVYACSFCQTPFMFKAKFRHRTVEDVRHHIDRMRELGSTFVRFLTPTSLSYGSPDTTPNLEAVEALLASVREGAGADAKVFFGTFPSEIRPEHITPRALEIMARYITNRTLVMDNPARIACSKRRGVVTRQTTSFARWSSASRRGFDPTSTSCSGYLEKKRAIASRRWRSPSGSSGWGRAFTRTRSCRFQVHRYATRFLRRSSPRPRSRCRASSREAKRTGNGAASSSPRPTSSVCDAMARARAASQAIRDHVVIASRSLHAFDLRDNIVSFDGSSRLQSDALRLGISNRDRGADRAASASERARGRNVDGRASGRAVTYEA